MSIKKIVKTLCGDSPGRNTDLIYYRIGPDQPARKIYLQAAMHADEQPGILVLHHLLELLTAADKAGQLKAEFVIFPMVNPIGMGNIELGQHQGRYDRPSGVNFNRQWPDLYHHVGDSLNGKMTANEAENIQAVRTALEQWCDKLPAITARDQLRKLVISEACNADYIFDLHCDTDALIHIFTVPQIADEMQRLADWTGSAALLLAEDSGAGSFDEVWPLIWIKLAAANPGKPIPVPIRSGTIEYRGYFDTFDGINRKDAENLFGYFQSEGLIGGKTRPAPENTCKPSDLKAVEYVRVEQAGLVAFCVELGDVIDKGDKIADLVALDGDNAFIGRMPILAGTSGFIISRCFHKYVWRNAIVATIVGQHILESRSENLHSD